MSQHQYAIRNAQILEDMGRKLAALPQAQQTHVAFYARGLRDGLRLGGEHTLSRARNRKRMKPPGTEP